MLRNCCHIPELFSYSSPVAVATRLLSEDSTALKEEVKKMKREIELLGAENEDLALSRSDLPRKQPKKGSEELSFLLELVCGFYCPSNVQLSG